MENPTYQLVDGDLVMKWEGRKPFYIHCPLNSEVRCNIVCPQFEFCDGKFQSGYKITGPSILLHCCKREIEIEVVDPSEHKGG